MAKNPSHLALFDVGSAFVETSRQTKVGHLDRHPFRHQDIPGRQISMDKLHTNNGAQSLYSEDKFCRDLMFVFRLQRMQAIYQQDFLEEPLMQVFENNTHQKII